MPASPAHPHLPPASPQPTDIRSVSAALVYTILRHGRGLSAAEAAARTRAILQQPPQAA